MEGLRLDKIIHQLLGYDAEGSVLGITDITKLFHEAKKVFMSQPCLLELQVPIKICGHIWGEYGDLLRIFECRGFPPRSNYLFLGNYAFEGRQGFQTLCLLLAFKVKYPNNLFLLRGEYDEVGKLDSLRTLRPPFDFGDKEDEHPTLLESLNNCFSYMPVAAVVDKKIFCAHGGISPLILNLEQIRRMERPATMHIPSLLRDFIMSKPDSAIQGWGMIDCNFTFGPDKVSDFLEKFDMELICRGGHVADEGYEFFADKQLVSIFSAPNFGLEGAPSDGQNSKSAGCIIEIDDTLMFRFLILHDARGTTDKQMFQNKATQTLTTVRIGRNKELKAVIIDEFEVTKLETQPVDAKDSNNSSQTVDIETLQRERDDALKKAEALHLEAEALRLKIQQLTTSSSESSSTNISYEELQQATENFDESRVIGQGGFAIVYKGFLRGTNVAIKKLRPERQIEQSGFDKEAAVLSKVRHPNLVTLIGFSSQPFTLVYEYLSKGSLEDRLKCKNGSPPLSWQVRTRIISEIHSALVFLHSNKPHPIVHGDVKPDNIFLDANLVSKLGDFGLCSILDSSRTNSFYHLTDHPKGTVGYIDPGYLTTGELTTESDVYSFGVIILRLVSGRPVKGIINLAKMAIQERNLSSMIDPSVGAWLDAQAIMLIRFGFKCCDPDRTKRPELGGREWRNVIATFPKTRR